MNDCAPLRPMRADRAHQNFGADFGFAPAAFAQHAMRQAHGENNQQNTKRDARDAHGGARGTVRDV